MNVCRLFSFSLTKIFFHITVNFNKLGCKILSVHHLNALQNFIHTESWVFKTSIISQPYYVSFTDNLSVPQTMDYSVNQSFAKLVSSTDNSSNCTALLCHCIALHCPEIPCTELHHIGTLFEKAEEVSCWMLCLGRSQGQNPRGRRPHGFWSQDLPRHNIHHDTSKAFS